MNRRGFLAAMFAAAAAPAIVRAASLMPVRVPLPLPKEFEWADITWTPGDPWLRGEMGVYDGIRFVAGDQWTSAELAAMAALRPRPLAIPKIRVFHTAMVEDLRSGKWE